MIETPRASLFSACPTRRAARWPEQCDVNRPDHFGRLLRTATAALLFAFVSGNAAVAQAPPPLTPEQEAIARRLDGMFIAPCCFINTLAEHRSPVAEQLRQELRTMLAGGATETQVVDAFVAKYGERILAAPKPQGFNLLAYVLPFVALALGLVVIALTLPRRRPRGVEPSAVPPETATDALRARMEAELTHFDD
ncbi:MAG: cytochrome c-type biogenesis protein CcmH [Candidatus Binatia bacterium]